MEKYERTGFHGRFYYTDDNLGLGRDFDLTQEQFSVSVKIVYGSFP